MLFRLTQVLLIAVILLSCNTTEARYIPRIAYMLHCGGCHLADGRSNPPEVPDLRNELGKIVSIPGGRDYLVRVPGASQAPVSDEELAHIINWVLKNFNADTLPDNFSPLTGDEVSRSRKNVLINPIEHRAALWDGYTD